MTDQKADHAERLPLGHAFVYGGYSYRDPNGFDLCAFEIGLFASCGLPRSAHPKTDFGQVGRDLVKGKVTATQVGDMIAEQIQPAPQGEHVRVDPDCATCEHGKCYRCDECPCHKNDGCVWCQALERVFEGCCGRNHPHHHTNVLGADGPRSISSDDCTNASQGGGGELPKPKPTQHSCIELEVALANLASRDSLIAEKEAMIATQAAEIERLKAELAVAEKWRDHHQFGRRKPLPLPKGPMEPGLCPRCDEAACMCSWELCKDCGLIESNFIHKDARTKALFERAERAEALVGKLLESELRHGHDGGCDKVFHPHPHKQVCTCGHEALIARAKALQP